MTHINVFNWLFGVLNYYSGYFFYQYAKLVHHTARWEYENTHHHEAVYTQPGAVILAFWHEFYLSFLAYGHYLNGKDFTCIALGGPKGRGFRVIARLFGASMYLTKKGDKEVNRQAVAGVVNEMRTLGKNTFIAVDGPNGPAREVKFGVSKMATEAGATILPLKMQVSGKLRVPRWDSQIIPLPFARIRVIYGEPISGNQDRPAIVEKTSISLHALPD
ncbi:MAG: hypothetical protein DHS20C20_12040 [Ardenticatenaceae bacterium]|nr:MAG: hypothetical protein DHS20C20_12040 [Ardenticatenaceae bacterium]